MSAGEVTKAATLGVRGQGGEVGARTSHGRAEEEAGPPESEAYLADFYRRHRAKQLLELAEAREHPAAFLDRVLCVDHTTGERFKFNLLHPEEPWYWQRELLDDWLGCPKHISLKARQIGITWLAAGLGLWRIVWSPGTQVLIVSIKEDEAVKIVNRIWDMWLSIPDHLRNHAIAIKPQRGRPTADIELQFPDGRVSMLRGLTSTPTAGHGSTAALVILDEFSRQPYAAETWKAVLPTTQGGGSVLVISTGNGVSNQTGGGNFFHHLWANTDTYGIEKRFLAWDLHPKRDEEWYRVHAMALPPAERGEQYPRNELEAFILGGRPYFDPDAIIAYTRSESIPKPLYRLDFEQTEGGKQAALKRWASGLTRIYQEPIEGHEYAIGADVATGRGFDFSAAYVVDLASMRFVAEFHAKLDADEYAEQLHYLGKWYKNALIAVETQGGFGESVIISLRDGRAGRPAYPRLYRHILSSRPDMPHVKPFGFPMNVKTRALAINQLEKAIRERTLLFLTEQLASECLTFVHADTHPSPRAQEGCNDDCVFAAAIALELYRLYGQHPKRAPRRRGRKQTHSYLA